LAGTYRTWYHSVQAVGIRAWKQLFTTITEHRQSSRSRLTQVVGNADLLNDFHCKLRLLLQLFKPPMLKFLKHISSTFWECLCFEAPFCKTTPYATRLQMTRLDLIASHDEHHVDMPVSLFASEAQRAETSLSATMVLSLWSSPVCGIVVFGNLQQKFEECIFKPWVGSMRAMAEDSRN
jgi:hypothetical protein